MLIRLEPRPIEDAVARLLETRPGASRPGAPDGGLLPAGGGSGEPAVTGWALAEPDAPMVEVALEVEGSGTFLVLAQQPAAPELGLPEAARIFSWPVPAALRDGQRRRLTAWHLGTGREIAGSPAVFTAHAGPEAAAAAGPADAPPLMQWREALAGHVGAMPPSELADGLWVGAQKPALSLRYELAFAGTGDAEQPPGRVVRLIADEGGSRVSMFWRVDWTTALSGVPCELRLRAWLPEALERNAQAQLELWLVERRDNGFVPLRRLRRTRIFRRPVQASAEVTLTEEEAAAAGALWLGVEAVGARGLCAAPPRLDEAAPPAESRMEDWRLQGAFDALAELVRVHNEAAAETHPILPPFPAAAGQACTVPAEVAGGWHPFTQIVLPVYNGDEIVRLCIRSLKEAATGPMQVLLVDDGSRDFTAAMLREEAAGDPRFVLHRRDVNRGYTKSINEGVLLTRADWIVILNSDTILSKGWLDRLFAAVRARPGTGVAGPLSNAATWQSIPAAKRQDGSWSTNDMIAPGDVARVQALLDAHSERAYPEFPVLNGFCTLIARAVFDRVGLYDEEAFPMGYGEETDLCLRARRAGFRLTVADDCFVYHHKSISFGSANRSRLTRAGGLEMTNKHLGVTIGALEQAMQACQPMVRLRARMMDLLTGAG